jgi:hypothetical protein
MVVYILTMVHHTNTMQYGEKYNYAEMIVQKSDFTPKYVFVLFVST